MLREIASTATADPGEGRVSAGHLAIAEDVAHHEGTSVGEIARRTGLAQSLVSKTVAQMREAGIFVTSQDPSDGRRQRVGIDPGARADVFAARGARPIGDAIRSVQPSLSKADARRVEQLLDELAARLGGGAR